MLASGILEILSGKLRLLFKGEIRWKKFPENKQDGAMLFGCCRMGGWHSGCGG